jgi:GABA(A) receptor-associated protein
MSLSREKKTPHPIKPEEIERLLLKHPHSIPVYISKAPQSKNDVPDIRKNKYLIPYDYSIANVMFLIRKSIQIRQEQAIFLFIENQIPPQTMLLQQAYEKYKSPDGLLRITYALENTFG